MRKIGLISILLLLGLIKGNSVLAANECTSSDVNDRCMHGSLYYCAQDSTGYYKWIEDGPCDSGYCIPDNSRCADVGEEAGSVKNGTYYTNSDGAVIPSYPSGFKFASSSIGDIVSALLPYIFTIAGLILLVILIFGGMGLMTAAGDPKKIEAAKGRITMALVGFLIVFASYFIAQIVQVMLGVNFLGTGMTGTN